MRHRLTELSTLHFLRRDGKGGKNPKHDLDDYIHHSRCPCDARVYFELIEETSDEIKGVYKLVSTRVDTFSRLVNLGVKTCYAGSHERHGPI